MGILLPLAILRQRRLARAKKRRTILLALLGANLAYFMTKLKIRHYLQRRDLVARTVSPWTPSAKFRRDLG